jgi:monovalent cation:H+ antiporter-2, CPA2 family
MENELLTLGVLFFFAIVGALIAKRFNQPSVLGLLLVGAVIGPNALKIVTNQAWIDMLMELGTILLLFIVGLEFTPAKLMKLGFKALIIAILKVGLAFTFGFYIAILLGFPALVGVFTGTILSFSSTVVIVKILEEKGLYKRHETPLLLTVLIIEDLLIVLALMFFATLKDSVNIIAIGKNITLAITAMLVIYFLMKRFARTIFDWFMKNGSEEIVPLLALGFCTGFSALAFMIGLSTSAGAFLAGNIVASLPQAKAFEKALSPYVLTFSALFFISVGTMVNFANILPNLTLILLLLGAVLISRFLAIGVMSYIFGGFKEDQAFFSSLVMLSVGPFALLVAKESTAFNLGVDLVTVTSVIIFISAVMMSLCVASTDFLYKFWNRTKRPAYVNHSVRQLAWYVRSFFAQLDIENSATKNFKAAATKSIIAAIVVMFILVGWDRLLTIVSKVTTQGLILNSISLLFVGATGYGLYLLYKKLKNTQNCFVRILAKIDVRQNHRKAKKIYKYLGIALSTLTFALFFPIPMFLLDLPVWSGFSSLVLLTACFIYFRLAMKLLNTYTSAQFEKKNVYNGMTLNALTELTKKRYRASKW